MKIIEGDDGNKVKIVKIARPNIIRELVQKDIQFIPCTVDLHMREGLALKWLRSSLDCKPFDSSHHNFGNIDGSEEGKLMYSNTKPDTQFCNIYIKARKSWTYLHDRA
eukprot:15358611-Ditylum_brightwellii.AAC.1